ncbi:hypothetical protein GCM10012280_36030 [Wenjunlia tyrosinilytica]|uniref:Uncharacterized protein n=1 Tax=Wenjunlia tyrosinilytica TaxID=1544741 RepID=A0A918DZ64_9ACTN|nr:hypothetical protein GCM10012280_36030 [Wenjunlia tyrosinilytica]
MPVGGGGRGRTAGRQACVPRRAPRHPWRDGTPDPATGCIVDGGLTVDGTILDIIDGSAQDGEFAETGVRNRHLHSRLAQGLPVIRGSRAVAAFETADRPRRARSALHSSGFL